jgi:hypothetical protein
VKPKYDFYTLLPESEVIVPPDAVPEKNPADATSAGHCDHAGDPEPKRRRSTPLVPRQPWQALRRRQRRPSPKRRR